MDGELDVSDVAVHAAAPVRCFRKRHAHGGGIAPAYRRHGRGMAPACRWPDAMAASMSKSEARCN
jgi:hypothetical protein